MKQEKEAGTNKCANSLRVYLHTLFYNHDSVELVHLKSIELTRERSAQMEGLVHAADGANADMAALHPYIHDRPAASKPAASAAPAVVRMFAPRAAQTRIMAASRVTSISVAMPRARVLALLALKPWMRRNAPLVTSALSSLSLTALVNV